MVTKEQAIILGEKMGIVHYGHCTRTIGPRGGISMKIVVCHVNGKCRTWKKDPTHFSLPVKHGLRDYGHITEENQNLFHLIEDCPIPKPKLDTIAGE